MTPATAAALAPAAALVQVPAPAGPMPGTQRPRLGEMACTAACAREARRMVRCRMRAWGLERLAGDVELLVSEIVANAVQHTGNRTVMVGP